MGIRDPRSNSQQSFIAPHIANAVSSAGYVVFGYSIGSGDRTATVYSNHGKIGEVNTYAWSRFNYNFSFVLERFEETKLKFPVDETKNTITIAVNDVDISKTNEPLFTSMMDLIISAAVYQTSVDVILRFKPEDNNTFGIVNGRLEQSHVQLEHKISEALKYNFMNSEMGRSI